MRTPTIQSDWVRIVEYPRHHLNDFCLFPDAEGRWHGVGICGDGTWESETALFHSVGADLASRFDNLAPILADAHAGGSLPQKHAPFVVERNGIYHLFYRQPRGTILCVRSADPFRWTNRPEPVFEKNDARDVCILAEDDGYLMYYCQHAPVEGVPRSCILMRRSKDLADWSEPVIVFYDTLQAAEHSYLESPCVIRERDGYYLFLRHRLLDQTAPHPSPTVVLHSDRPDRFPAGTEPWFHCLFDIHAPEIVRHDGRWWIARVSGTGHAGRDGQSFPGWVEIAEMTFCHSSTRPTE